MIPPVDLIDELPLDPQFAVCKAAGGGNRGVSEERGEAVGAVLLIRIPDFDVTAERPEVLHGCIEQCGLAYPLSAQRDP